MKWFLSDTPCFMFHISSLRDNRFLIRIKMFKRDARALDHAVNRIFRKSRLHAGPPVNELGEIAELGRAAGHDDSLVDDVRSELRRSLLQHIIHRLYHLAKLAADRLHDLVRLHFRGAGQACDEVAALDEHRELLLERHRRTDVYLYILGHLVADGEVEGLFDVVGDRGIDAVPRALHRSRRNDAAQSEDGDVGRAAADIDDHVSGRFLNGDACADGGEDGLLHDICVLRSRLDRRLDDCAALGRGDSCRHREQHLRFPDVPFAERLADEVAEHGLGHAVIGDDTVFHGTVRDDGFGCLPYHILRLNADCEYLVVLLGHGNDGRLIQHDTLFRHIHERVRRAEVDAEFGGEEAHTIRTANRYEITNEIVPCHSREGGNPETSLVPE